MPFCSPAIPAPLCHFEASFPSHTPLFLTPARRFPPSCAPTVFFCRFLFRQKAAEKPLLTDVSAYYGRTKSYFGRLTRVCKQTGPYVDAFNPSYA